MAVISCKPFGTTTLSEPVSVYTLQDDSGVTAEIITYGGILRSLCVPGRQGTQDVVLGYDSLRAYEKGDKYFGALIGRVANRTAGGRFILNGQEYVLACNDGANHLHGGLHGFDRRIWNAKVQDDVLLLSLVSEDFEEGYPGELRVQVEYRLNNGELSIVYTAESSEDTIVNLTNHSYFNLEGSDSILNHTAVIYANAYTELDGTAIPTGKILPVDGTPLDFREAQTIGSRIDDIALSVPRGYDHNYISKRRADDHDLRLAAEVTSQKAGRRLECLTTQPGLQFYTGNYLDGTVPGKGGQIYTPRSGFCLEAQGWPNAINLPQFPSIILRAHTQYHHKTIYRFSWF